MLLLLEQNDRQNGFRRERKKERRTDRKKEREREQERKRQIERKDSETGKGHKNDNDKRDLWKMKERKGNRMI